MSFKFVPKDLTNKSAYVQVTTYCQLGTKPLPEYQHSSSLRIYVTRSQKVHECDIWAENPQSILHCGYELIYIILKYIHVFQQILRHMIWNGHSNSITISLQIKSWKED